MVFCGAHNAVYGRAMVRLAQTQGHAIAAYQTALRRGGSHAQIAVAWDKLLLVQGFVASLCLQHA